MNEYKIFFEWIIIPEKHRKKQIVCVKEKDSIRALKKFNKSFLRRLICNVISIEKI